MKEKIKEKLNNAAKWIDDNRELLIAYVPVALAGITLTSRCVKSRTQRRSAKLEQLKIYDHSIGSYLYLRRPLTNEEKVILANRPVGMSVTNILDTLGVLK